MTACCTLGKRTYRVRFRTGHGGEARVGVLFRGWGLWFGVSVGVECERLVCAKLDGRSLVVFCLRNGFVVVLGRRMGSCTLVCCEKVVISLRERR